MAAATGDGAAALAHIDAAIALAPRRAYYRIRKGVQLLGMGRMDEARAVIGDACCISPDNAFDADLKLALAIAREDTVQLADVLAGECGCGYSSAQRAHAALALGDTGRALELYAEDVPDVRKELFDLVTDDWVWRLSHVVNHAHLRLLAGESEARAVLQSLLGELAGLAEQGIVNPLLHYWSASAQAVLGNAAAARAELRRARELGWQHEWWRRVDWNLAGIEEGAHD